MVAKEHDLMLLMFTRLYEAIGLIEETLKSRGIWTGDDPTAFAHAIHSDNRRLLAYATRARNDYVTLAKELGVVYDAKS